MTGQPDTDRVERSAPVDTPQACTPCPEPIRVLVADDHAIVRKGICALLATETSIEVVGEAVDGQSAIEQAERLRPDVVLMDLVMPGVDGLEATRHITACQPQARILVLTSFAGVDKIMPAIKAGALGYLLKDSDPEVLVESIQQVYCGNSSLHPSVARALLDKLAHPEGEGLSSNIDLCNATGEGKVEALTEREVEVLRLVARGWSNQNIADELMISEATVRTHVSHVLAKLDLTSRTQAALYALRKGWASLDDTEAAETG
jgi:NarL family two-component system response regulator LiaR